MSGDLPRNNNDYNRWITSRFSINVLDMCLLFPQNRHFTLHCLFQPRRISGFCWTAWTIRETCNWIQRWVTLLLSIIPSREGWREREEGGGGNTCSRFIPHGLPMLFSCRVGCLWRELSFYMTVNSLVSSFCLKMRSIERDARIARSTGREQQDCETPDSSLLISRGFAARL